MINLLLMALLCATISEASECPQGSVRGIDNCYIYSTEPTVWFHAEQDCVQRGGHLASSRDAAENAFIQSNWPTSSSTFWLGGSVGIISPINWTWTDGANFEYTNWAKGNFYESTPRGDGQSNGACLSISLQNGLWFNDSCSASKPYICEVLPRNDESPSACPSGWTYFDVTDSCYRVFKGPNGWVNYESLCTSYHAHLASIHSHEEHEFVQELSSSGIAFNGCYTDPYYFCGVWIGLTRAGTADFHWSDETAMNFTNWSPSGQLQSANYALILPDQLTLEGDKQSQYRWSTWDGIDGVSVRAGVCKKPAKH